MPEIDRLLPKPMEEMTVADVKDFMEQTNAKLALWLLSHNGGAGKIQADRIIEAIQSITWGLEIIENVQAAVSPEDEPEYNFEEAIWFIHQRTDLPDGVIRRVLEADNDYAVDKGIVERDPTPGAAPGVQ